MTVEAIVRDCNWATTDLRTGYGLASTGEGVVVGSTGFPVHDIGDRVALRLLKGHAPLRMLEAELADVVSTGRLQATLQGMRGAGLIDTAPGGDIGLTVLGAELAKSIS